MGLEAIVKALPVVGGAAAAAIEQARSLCPRLEDQVTVEVIGQPGSTKRQLYHLALAAANGIVRRYQNLFTFNPLLPPPFGQLKIEYDAADHWVRCTLFYSVGTLNAAATTGPNRDKFYEAVAVYAGPECNVVGGEFGFVNSGTGVGGGLAEVLGDVGGRVLSGLPVSSVSKEAPKLEFLNRTILTPCPEVADPRPGFGPPAVNRIPSPNPRPPGDNRSRGVVAATPRPGDGVESNGCCSESLLLVPLVFAALSDPGSAGQEVFPAPKIGVGGG